MATWYNTTTKHPRNLISKGSVPKYESQNTKSYIFKNKTTMQFLNKHNTHSPINFK